MPRYHFNVFDGATSLDYDGTEVSGWRDALQQAVRLAGEIFTFEAAHLAFVDDWHMEVTDEDKFILFRLDFSVSKAAAITDRLREMRADGANRSVDGP